jgi:hypothetical protein
MKRYLIFGLALLFTVPMKAQVEKDGDYEKMKQESQIMFEQFKQQANKEFEDFRQKANAEYARFMEEAWTLYDVHEAEEVPMEPKPVITYEHEARVTNSLIEYDVIEDAPAERLPSRRKPLDLLNNEDLELVGQPEPLDPIMATFDANATMQSLSLYGSQIKVRVEPEPTKPIQLKNISEKSVAKMWKKLSCPYYDNVVAECLKQRKACHLCDWAYVKLAEKMANKYFGQDTNESVVLQMYILVQSGYQMRIARTDDRLTLLMGSNEKIYRYKYFVMDGIQYYIIDSSLQDKSMLVYDRAFPQEKSLSLAMVQPKLSLDRTEKQTFSSQHYPEITVEIETNKNLLDFYNDYPVSSQWNYYSYASLSECVKRDLYPTLQKAIEGKKEVEAVNMLLDFVQTGFGYSSDLDQFGYERPLYPDETFYYPYCDCEDRSILFSCLVRELIGLDVVLLSYPGHVTTAVHFNEPVKGDYLTIGDEIYVICEPTCVVGAPVGFCADKFKEKKPTVMRL